MDLSEDILEQLDKTALITVIIKQAEIIKDLHKRIEELERSSQRQAAPFRIAEKKRKPNPKPPGRKKGHKASYRSIPKKIDEQIEVPLPSRCSHCGTDSLMAGEAIKHYIEEIPKVGTKVYELTTWKAICRNCGKQSESSQPLKMSNATGAASSQVGPDAKSLSLRLQYQYGLSKRKTSSMLKDLYGLTFTASGLVNAAHRLADKSSEDYQSLMEYARKSAVIHADETSWYVGSPKYWLWVFTKPDLSLYKVADNRSRKTIEEVLGKSYKGILVSDCLNIYDDVNDVQQKCYSHHLKAITEAMDKHENKGDGFLKDLKRLLKVAIALKKSKDDLNNDQYKQCCLHLEKNANKLLEASRSNRLEEQIANRIRKQRDHLFTFLYHDQVDATNNLAERQLRPAVISRKLSCGNKTEKGARTWQIITSLCVTRQQRQQDVASFFTDKARYKP